MEPQPEGAPKEITGFGYTRCEDGGGMVSLFASLRATPLVLSCVDPLCFSLQISEAIKFGAGGGR